MALVLKFVSEKEDYFKNFIVKKIIKNKGNVCYISFNKSCNSVYEKFVDRINFDNFYVIDAVTKLLKEPSDSAKCKFIRPYEIDNLKNNTKNFIKKGCNLVIFDSLSNLIIYEQMIPAGAGIIVKFINEINYELMKKSGDIILICKSKDKNNLLIEETEKYIKNIKNG